MSPKPLNSDGEKDKHKAREELLTEVAGLRELVTTLKGEQAGRDRVPVMLDDIAEPFLIIDDASEIIYANAAARSLFGKKRETIEGMSFWDIYPKSKDALFYRAYEKSRQDRTMVKIREKHRLLDRWFETYLYPVSGGMTVLFHDVTTARHVDEISRLALVLLHNLKENIFLLRGDGRMFHVNDETRDSLGYSKDQLVKMSIFDVVPPEYTEDWRGILDRIQQHGAMIFESRLRARDGQEFPVEVYANFIELYGQAYYTITARDITERKRAGEARAFLASIVDSTDDAIIGKGLDGTITSWNLGAENLYGYKSEDAIGQNISMLAPSDRPDEIPMTMEKIRQGERVVHFQTVRKKNDGTLVDVSVTVSPMFDDNGQIMGSSTIAHDVTELKRYEEALIDAKSRAEMYVDLMGHDINNMNMITMGNLEVALMMLEQTGKADPESKALLAKSLESLENSSALIRNVQKLQQASTDGSNLHAMDMAEVIESVLSEFKVTPGKDVSFSFCRAQVCTVNADELLRDVFSNIIGNAIKHSSPAGKLIIGISLDSVKKDGKMYCRAAFEDDGPGIPDEVKDRLFRRFSRGATKARGSGLGLYLVKTLVEHYGGSIQVEDRVPGDWTQGVKFVVTIPAVE
jgi:PAS domain S-box-containing protein